jgi:hypothetical protein
MILDEDYFKFINLSFNLSSTFEHLIDSNRFKVIRGTLILALPTIYSDFADSKES